MTYFLHKDNDKILDDNYSKLFLNNISKNINNILDDTIIFNNDIEGFDTIVPKDILDNQIKRDKEMKQIINDRNKMISDNSSKQKSLLDKAVYFINATNERNKYSGKNIRFKNGNVGYVTQKGYYKHYPNLKTFNNTAGKNGCPKIISEELDIPFYDVYEEGKIIHTDPELIVGTPMQNGQTCGKEGKTVQVTSLESDNSPFTYVGCYKSNPIHRTKMEYQSDLGNSSTFNNCKIRANDRGYNIFGLRGANGHGRQKCYIGKDLKSATSNGLATKRNISYNLIKNNTVIKNQQIKSGLMTNGQLALGPRNVEPKLWKETRFYPNKRCHKQEGGFINLNNAVASYGVNCNGRIK